MKILSQIFTYIQNLSSRTFRLYAMIGVGALFLVIIGVSIQYYRTTRALSRRIKRINAEREDTVRIILAQAARIKEQQEELNRALSEDVDFKIAGYFTSVLETLSLEDKKITETTEQHDIDALYRESVLRVRLESMNMKEVAELLQTLENNQRISTKQLDIIKSVKKPGTVEVQLTIATMLLKTFAES